MTTIPDRIREEARALGECHALRPSAVMAIEQALLAAEKRGREEAAKIADAYADENIAMAGDTIMIDPVLNGKRGQTHTEEEWKRANDLMIEGCIHSSMFHAAQNIAAAIRSTN